MPRTKSEKGPRENRVGFVCDDREREMLEQMANDDGRTVSDWLRRMIRTSHASKFGPEPLPEPAKKETKRTAPKP